MADMRFAGRILILNGKYVAWGLNGSNNFSPIFLELFNRFKFLVLSAVFKWG